MAASWENYLPTGFEPIDREHRDLCGCLRELLAAVNEADGRRARGALEGLLRASREHFAHEERLMREHRYPLLARHKETHDLYLADVAQHLSQLAARGISPQFRRWATGRVLEWVRLHIAANDVALGAFLRAVPAAAPAAAEAAPADPAAAVKAG